METGLQRFLDAQSEDYALALSEIRQGMKRSTGYGIFFRR